MNSHLYQYCLILADGVDHRFCQHHQPSTAPTVQNRATGLQQTVGEDKEATLDKLALVEYIDKQGHYGDNLCNVFRSGINSESKLSTYGFLANEISAKTLKRVHEQGGRVLK